MYKINNSINITQFFLFACLLIVMGCSRVWALYEPATDEFYLNQPLLNQVEFTEKSTSPLKGMWQYYPEQFIVNPSAILKSQAVALPISFKEITGKNQTYGTFIGHFKIPKEYIGRRIAVYIPNQYGAYRMYLNGDFILRLGEISENAKNQETESAPRIAYFYWKKNIFL